MSEFDSRLHTCIEDVFSTVHSYWSLVTLYDALIDEASNLAVPLKLGLANSLTGLQHLVVLGVCRLDDDNASLRHAAAAIKISEGTRYTELMTAMKEYRNDINHLKDQHRKKYIAHVTQKVDFDNLPELPPLLDYVRTALTIVERFSGSPVDLTSKTAGGWSLDLRAWLIGYSNPHKL